MFLHAPMAPVSKKTTRRKPGRPVGSTNKKHTKTKTTTTATFFTKTEQRGPATSAAGRPKGSRNKKGVKIKPPSKVDFAFQYERMNGAPAGAGTIIQLVDMLEECVRTKWTDEKILTYFGSQSKHDPENIENQCHFYCSSKGRLVADPNS